MLSRGYAVRRLSWQHSRWQLGNIAKLVKRYGAANAGVERAIVFQNFSDFFQLCEQPSRRCGLSGVQLGVSKQALGIRPCSVSESGLLTHQNFKLTSQLIDSLRFLFQLLCLIAAHLRL